MSPFLLTQTPVLAAIHCVAWAVPVPFSPRWLYSHRVGINQSLENSWNAASFWETWEITCCRVRHTVGLIPSKITALLLGMLRTGVIPPCAPEACALSCPETISKIGCWDHWHPKLHTHFGLSTRWSFLPKHIAVGSVRNPPAGTCPACHPSISHCTSTGRDLREPCPLSGCSSIVAQLPAAFPEDVRNVQSRVTLNTFGELPPWCFSPLWSGLSVLTALGKGCLSNHAGSGSYTSDYVQAAFTMSWNVGNELFPPSPSLYHSNCATARAILRTVTFHQMWLWGRLSELSVQKYCILPQHLWAKIWYPHPKAQEITLQIVQIASKRGNCESCYFKSVFKELVMISLQENTALSGASRKECPGLRNTSWEVKGGQQEHPSAWRAAQGGKTLLFGVCNSDADLVNSEGVKG